MHGIAAFVYHASTVDTIGCIPSECWRLTARYFQQSWTRYSSRIAIFIYRLHWTPPLILIISVGRNTISDGNVAIEKGAEVLHSFNTALPRLSDMRLADALVIINLLFMHKPAWLLNCGRDVLNAAVECVDGPARLSTSAASANASSPSRTISRSTFVRTPTKDRSSVQRAPRLFVVKITCAITSMYERDKTEPRPGQHQLR